MARLDIEKQNQLEPIRVKRAFQALRLLGVEPQIVTKSEINFMHNGYLVRLFPYSGWHSGHSIKDGRGLDNLIKQLK